MEELNYNLLKEISYQQGCLLFGVAPLEKVDCKIYLPDEIIKKMKYAISIGYVLSKEILNTIDTSPTIIYSYHYRKANDILDDTGLILSSKIIENGYSALPIPASQVIDFENYLGQLPHKIIGYYAGLGWIGRSNLLINPKYGARVRYATVLTDIPLKIDTPISNGCNNCRKCIEICPVSAIGETAKDYNLEKCANQLRIFSKKPLIKYMICGLCVKVCDGNFG